MWAFFMSVGYAYIPTQIRLFSCKSAQHRCTLIDTQAIRSRSWLPPSRAWKRAIISP